MKKCECSLKYDDLLSGSLDSILLCCSSLSSPGRSLPACPQKVRPQRRLPAGQGADCRPSVPLPRVLMVPLLWSSSASCWTRTTSTRSRHAFNRVTQPLAVGIKLDLTVSRVFSKLQPCSQFDLVRLSESNWKKIKNRLSLDHLKSFYFKFSNFLPCIDL